MAKKGIILLVTLLFIMSISLLYLKNLDDTKKLIDISQTTHHFNYTTKIIEDINNLVASFNEKYELYTDNGFETFFATLPDEAIPLTFKNILLNIEFQRLDELCNIHDIYDTNETIRAQCEDIFVENNLNINSFILYTKDIFSENNSTISTHKQINNIIYTFNEKNDKLSSNDINKNITFISTNENTKYLKSIYQIYIDDTKANKITTIYKLKSSGIEVEDIEISY